MRTAVDYLPRHAVNPVCEALGDTRVVIINGARQAGKSTLAETILRRFDGGVARFLDRPVTRAAAEEDPVGFTRHDGLMLIDEVQRVPDLWLAIKYLVDREPRPGRFLLTGSARLLGLSSLPDALPGRTETIELWPLSQGEIDGAPDGFVDAAYTFGADMRVDPTDLRRADYQARAARGGFPEAVRRDTRRRRSRFFASYLSDLLVRDIKQVADIDRVSDMRRLMSLLAGQVGGLVKMDRLASELGIARHTVRHYLEILETIFLIKLLPAWSTSATTRAVSTPKLMFVDSGIASYLASGASPDRSAGSLLENFVLGELARQITWSENFVGLYHYRDRDQYEVDAVLEDNAGTVIGIEVKAAETVRSEDFRGLRRLQRRLGERFRAGFVLYSGEDALPFGDGLACLPISALWTMHASTGD